MLVFGLDDFWFFLGEYGYVSLHKSYYFSLEVLRGWL